MHVYRYNIRTHMCVELYICMRTHVRPKRVYVIYGSRVSVSSAGDSGHVFKIAGNA